MRCVLVCAAHPDDEALGCSGTLARHVAQGDRVHVLFMTDGVGARQAAADGGGERSGAARQAQAILGVESLQSFDFPDNQMDSVPLLNVTRAIESVLQALRPDLVYTHHPGDLNVDHQVTHRALVTACRPQPGFCVREICAFEVPSSTEWQTPGVLPFTPNLFVDISGFVESKRQALAAYQLEMRGAPHSRSIENVLRLNALRGNSVGVAYAEAFMLVRQIR